MAAMAWQFRAGNVAQKKWLGGLDMSEIHIKNNMEKLVYLLLYGHIWAIYWYIHGFGFQHDPTTQQWFLDVSCVNV